MKTYTVSDLKNELRKRNQQLIWKANSERLPDSEKIKFRDKFLVRCTAPECGYECKRSYCDVIHSKTQSCPMCSRSVYKGPDDLIKEVTRRGGTIESGLSKYKNVNSKVLVKCNFSGHPPFSASSHSIVNIGRWCKYCAMGIGERVCRAYFEAFTGLKFPPADLVDGAGPRRKGRLTLDGFNEETKIAFEYDGRHHDKQKQKARDQYKDELFKKMHPHGHLIRIIDPRGNKKIDEIRQSVFNELRKRKIKIVTTDPQITLASLYSHWLIRMKQKLEIAIAKNHLELVGPYLGVKNPVQVKHNCGGTFFRTPTKLMKFQGCPFCRKNDLLQKKKKQFAQVLKDHEYRMEDYITDKNKKVLILGDCVFCGRRQTFRQNGNSITRLKTCACSS